MNEYFLPHSEQDKQERVSAFPWQAVQLRMLLDLACRLIQNKLKFTWQNKSFQALACWLLLTQSLPWLSEKIQSSFLKKVKGFITVFLNCQDSAEDDCDPRCVVIS